MNKSTLHGFLEYLGVRKNEGTLKAVSGETRSYSGGTGRSTKIREGKRQTQ